MNAVMERRPLWFLLMATIAVGALAIFTNVVPFRQILDQRAQVDEARTTLERLEAENATLERQVTALTTPVEIERLAREKLGWVNEGEEAYVIVEPEASPSTYPEDELPVLEQSAGSDTGSWLQRMWDYITGRDLVGG